jgi:hypothetical protein
MTPDIRKPLKRFLPYFLQAREAGLNEADTVLRLIKFLEEVLGYNGIEDISREAELKHKYVDICLKVDGRVRLILEVKAAGQKLRDRHIEQAQSYASQNNYRWVVLTNGLDWHLYHLTFEEGIEYERAFVVSLENEAELDAAAAKLALLHKQAIKKGELEVFWQKASALGAGTIGKVVFSESVLMLIRRELRKETGLLIDREDLARSLHEMLSAESREQIGPLRIRKRRRPADRGSSREEGDEVPAETGAPLAEADPPAPETPSSET